MAILEPNKIFKRTLHWLIFLTFDLMILGAGVRAMDAGLTCPDWPLCFGRVIPAYHFGVYLEFIHRAIAGVVALLFVFLFIQVFRNPSLKFLRTLSVMAFFLLISQIVMGGLTVLKLLDYWTVTTHLSLATAFLANLLIIRHKWSQKTLPEQKKANSFSRTLQNYNRLSVFSLFAVCLQLVLGGLVASTYSGLICVDFPTCNGQWVPTLTGPVGLQVWHRFGAYLLVLLVTTSFFYSRSCYQQGLVSRARYQGSLRALIIIFCQLVVGVLNLQWLLPPWLTVLHSALAILLFINLLQVFLLSAKVESSQALGVST